MEEVKRNIFEKMSEVKLKLLGIKKGGKNEFAKYSYFELGDIMPVLLPALKEARLHMQIQFSKSEQSASLKVVDIDNTDSSIVFETQIAECNLKAAHAIQNLGAAQTYTRRYLILTAFDIAEADAVDAGERPEDSPKKYKPDNKPNEYNRPAEKAPPSPQPPSTYAADPVVKGIMDAITEAVKPLPEKTKVNIRADIRKANRDPEVLRFILRNIKLVPKANPDAALPIF
jgi:hypothetical protein